MVKESWKKSQVAIFGVIGILLIFTLVVVKLGANTNDFVGHAYVDYHLYDGTFRGAYCNPNFYDPVCSENRTVYNNACLARLSNQTIAYQGNCR